MNRRLAILGSTGLVGRTMLAVLQRHPAIEAPPRLLASDARGRTQEFRGVPIQVEAVTESAFSGVDIALFATSNEVSRRWATVATGAGAQVVDNSSAFRYEPAVPLVVPEINGRLLDARPPLVANPNCSTIGVVMAIAPLARLGRLVRLNVTTYQSVSGAGSEALEAFERDTRARLDPASPRADAGTHAYNVVPQIDRFEANGYTREEMKIVWESRKILDLTDLPVSATAVRVPVRVGHAAAVTAVFDRPIGPEEARAAWRAAAGVRVVDDITTGRYPTPLEAEGVDDVLVGRAREDLATPGALTFFVASDNLLKGAALNAVQIAERCAAVVGGTR